MDLHNDVVYAMAHKALLANPHTNAFAKRICRDDILVSDAITVPGEASKPRITRYDIRFEQFGSPEVRVFQRGVELHAVVYPGEVTMMSVNDATTDVDLAAVVREHGLGD